jgi:formate dehydrogenase major subunit
MYLVGENPVLSEANASHAIEAMVKAEFMVVQDIFMSETAELADVILPAASFAEKDGTFTNSERRVNRVRGVSRAPGEAKPDWWIFKQIAKRFGQDWASDSAQEIWDNEISVLAPQLAGVKYNRLEGDGLQWPCTDEQHPGTCFLHKDGEFTCGLGVFTPVEWTPPAEVPDEEYPFVLSTGRRLVHYHTRTQTGRCEGLNDLLGEETADISPEDAVQHQIQQGETIQVSSRRGKIELKANITGQVPKGLVWMAFHFREANANWLTNPVFDPVSLTAEYKACAVRIDKIQMRADKRA